MRNAVPEKHTQNTEKNHGIRLFTPDRVAIDAFGKPLEMPGQAVSSFLVGRSRIYGPRICYPFRVMYRGIISCYDGAAFDPHVKEVGKK